MTIFLWWSGERPVRFGGEEWQMLFRVLARAACVVALSAALSGCATTQSYDAMLNGWLGRNADQLVEAWGPPSSSYTYRDGRRSLQYASQATKYYPPVTSYDPYSGQQTILFNGYSRTLNCVTTFETDRQGTILSWKWHGNDCVAAPHLQAGGRRPPQ